MSPDISQRSQTFAWLLALLTSLTLSYFLMPVILNGTQEYPDFIPGLITFTDYYKSGELVLVVAFSMIFFVAFFGFCYLFSLSKSNFLNKADFRPLTLTEEILAAFSGFLIGMYVLSGKVSASYIACFAIFAFCSFFMRNKKTLQTGLVNFLFIPILIFFSFISLLCLYCFLFPVSPPTTDFITKTSCAVVLCGSVIYLICLKFSKFSEVFFLLIQIPLPLLLLRVCRVDFNSEIPYSITTNQFGSTLIISGIVILSLLNIRHIKQYFASDGEKNLNSLLTISSILAIAFYHGFYLPPVSPLDVDNFHLGEMTLPWQQIIHFNQKSYTEFVSIQGIMPLSIGFLNWLFYENSLASFSSANSLLLSLIVLLTAFFSSRLTAKSWTLLLLPVLIPFSDRYYLIPLSFLILANPCLLGKRLYWCITCFFVCLLACMWNPATGVAFSVAVFPLALFQLFFIYKENPKDIFSLKIPAVFLICCLISYLIFPLKGLIQFLLENGSTSLVAHGLAYFMTYDANTNLYAHFSSPFLNRIFFEILRTGSWILGSFVLVVPVFFSFRKLSKNEVLSLACMTTVAILFTYLMLPQSLGRVDSPPHLSRTGSHGMLMLSFFIPYTFILGKKFKLKNILPVIIVGFAISIPYFYKAYGCADIINKTIYRPVLPANYVLLDDKESYPELGKLFVSNARLAEIQSFKDAVSGLLDKGETYFDFTNNSVFHLILNLEYPSIYPFFSAVNRQIQNRIIEKIKKDPPSVVWIAPAIEFDRGAASLRAYRIYRWFLTNDYRYVKRGIYSFLVSPQKYTQLSLNDYNKDLIPNELLEIYFRPALDYVPNAWGRSFESLIKLVDVQNPQHLISQENSRSIKITFKSELSGKDADYLLLDISKNLPVKNEILAKLSWIEEGEIFSNDKYFNFSLKAGKLIIPVGSDPRWLLGNPKELLLTILNPRKKIIWKVEEVRILKLKE